MGLRVTAGRIRFDGQGGATKFDSSAEGLLLTDYRTGTFNLLAWSKSYLASGAKQRTYTQTLETGLPDGADIVVGSCIATSKFSNEHLPFGATTVILQGTAEIRSDPSASANYGFFEDEDVDFNVETNGVARAITPRISGNTLFVDIDEYFPAMQFNSIQNNAYSDTTITIRYFAFIGSFDQPGSQTGTKRMRAESSGIAVWRGAQDDAPFNNPQNNMSRVLFHSDLDNIGIDRIRTGTQVINGNEQDVTLFSHGQSGRPLIFGYVSIEGTNVPINGTMILRIRGGLFFATITANSSSVRLRITPVFDAFPNAGTLSVTYAVYVTNYAVNGSNQLVRPDYYDGLSVTSSRLRCGYFDTNTDYFEKGGGDDIPIANGRSITFGVLGTIDPVGNGYASLYTRYKVGAYLVDKGDYDISSTNSGSGQGYTGPATTNADITKVSVI